MRSTKICLGVLALICAVCSCSWAQDPGWPRKLVKPGGTVLVYQPQVDDWQNFTDIKWRAAFQLTPNGGKQIVGAASFEATTEVNTDNHTVLLFNINVTNTYFPGQEAGPMQQRRRFAEHELFRVVRPGLTDVNERLWYRLVAYMPKPEADRRRVTPWILRSN